eukprot:8111407-Pyramimonas_sp.AAC.1
MSSSRTAKYGPQCFPESIEGWAAREFPSVFLDSLRLGDHVSREFRLAHRREGSQSTERLR